MVFGVFEWFDLTEGTCDGDSTVITFEENGIPLLTEEHQHQKIVAKKFPTIMVTDFPLRGRPMGLTFPADDSLSQRQVR